MTRRLLIDAHEDLAFMSIYDGFDYTRSTAENRRNHSGPSTFQCMVGRPELVKAGAAVIFGTIFSYPKEKKDAYTKNGVNTYETAEDFHRAVLAQLDFYDRLSGEHPEHFRRIFSRADLDQILEAWEKDQESAPPTGLVGLMEGAEGLRSFDDLELYYERGIRLIGPVWGGGRWCAGTFSRDFPDALTDDGKKLLRAMSGRGFVLDVSHMQNRSAMDALDYYDGIAVATHANCKALLKGISGERHLNDETIRMLIEHDGVMGVIPYNSFLYPGWKEDGSMPRELVTMNTLADHVDHICQLAGHSRAAAIGTDADGGFGFPDIPYEMNDISGIQILAEKLADRGFSDEDIDNVFHKNWQRILERALK